MPIPSKAKEPSIDEILDSIRRIIADEDLTSEAGPESAARKAAGLSIQTASAAAKLRPVRETRYAPASKPEGVHAPLRDKLPPQHMPVRPANRYQAVSPARASSFIAQGPMKDAGPLMPELSEPPVQGDYPMNGPVSPSPGPRPPSPAKPSASSSTAEARHQPLRRDLLSPAVDAAVAAAFQSLGDLVLPQHERTVEDLVKEILRPMLKEWLDQNLAGIVEQLVRAEIQRVTGHLR